MNSKLRTALNSYKKAITDDSGTAWQQEESITEAEKAIRQAVGEEMLDIVGPDIYPERPSGGSNSWKAQDELRAELRQKIKQWQGGVI